MMWLILFIEKTNYRTIFSATKLWLQINVHFIFKHLMQWFSWINKFHIILELHITITYWITFYKYILINYNFRITNPSGGGRNKRHSIILIFYYIIWINNKLTTLNEIALKIFLTELPRWTGGSTRIIC
jgi:hypothetical protein